MAAFILLPILGVTWAVGLLAVNENTTVFTWLFTVFNSLQVQSTQPDSVLLCACVCYH